MSKYPGTMVCIIRCQIFIIKSTTPEDGTYRMTQLDEVTLPVRTSVRPKSTKKRMQKYRTCMVAPPPPIRPLQSRCCIIGQLYLFFSGIASSHCFFLSRVWLVVWYHRAIISYHIVSYRFSKTKQTKQNKQATMPTFQDTAPGTKSSKFTALDPFAPFLAQPVRFYICTLYVYVYVYIISVK